MYVKMCPSTHHRRKLEMHIANVCVNICIYIYLHVYTGACVCIYRCMYVIQAYLNTCVGFFSVCKDALFRDRPRRAARTYM